MEKIKATAIIHTRNAEQYLQEVIDHLAEFEEIMVVDMESSDSTLDIARKNGCRIENYPPCGYADPARDFAMRAATNDWVFFVDADEIIPAPLTAWIREFISSPGEIRGVNVARKNGFLDSWRRNDYPDYQMRILDRRHASWPPHVHSRPEVNGKTDSIPASRPDLAMFHKAPALEDVLERMNRYTTFETERMKGKKVTLASLVLKPTFRFIKAYFLKGGFREGLAGYISAKNDAIYKFYALSKAYEASLPPEAAKKP